jgi:pectate lyase
MRRRNLCSLLAGSSVAVALLSGGCIDAPKRARGHAGAAGTAGARGPTGGSGGRGGAVGESGEAGETGEAGANTQAEAGASGSLADAGMGGASDEAGGAPGAGTGTVGGGGTGGAQAGSGGYAGEVDTFNEPCPSSTLQGWASVAGLEFDPALARPAALEVTVSNAADLATYAASPDPYIIHISGTIALPALVVTSNKTIVGDGSDATLEGGIRIAGTSTAAADMVSNVVIRNLHINAISSESSSIANDSDGISIAYAHHVWIDHVDVWDAPGDAIDITNGSDYVTVSWTKFRFVDGFRLTGARVGDSDTNTLQDTGRLKVTFHHNWWTDSVDQRMPRVRFGDVHVFNNYYLHTNSIANSYCVAAAINSRLLVENNYFEGVSNPHVFFSFGSAASFSEPTAQMVATGNTYLGRSNDASGKQSGQGDSFTPPYPVTLEPADAMFRQFARHCTGPVAPVVPPVAP